MIQRIQTVYLALAILLNIAFFLSPLFIQAQLDPSGWLLPLLVAACGFAVILSLYAIFLYNNRLRQIQIVSYACLFQVIAFASAAGVFFSLGRLDDDSLWELFGVVVLVFALMLQFMSIKAIKKDINLIKSMDRIR